MDFGIQNLVYFRGGNQEQQNHKSNIYSDQTNSYQIPRQNTFINQQQILRPIQQNHPKMKDHINKSNTVIRYLT